MPFPLYILPDLSRSGLMHQGTPGDVLIIKNYEMEADRQNGYVIYRGGVEAIYGVTTLTTDTLIVRRGNKGDPPIEVKDGDKTYTLRPMEAVAVGKVLLVDPAGTIQAKNLWFTWDPDRRAAMDEVVGQGDSVDVHIANFSIRADKMSQSLKGIDFSHVQVSTSGWKHPYFKFDARSVFIEPGKRGTARSVRLSLLGATLPAIPLFRFTLDPRANGSQIPRVGLRQGSGIGMSWGGDFVTSDSTDISTAVNAYPKVQPTYLLSYGKSFVPAERAAENQFRVYDPFGERSDYSFFGNIYTNSIERAYEGLRTEKDLFSVGTFYNYHTLGRQSDDKISYSRPIEIGYSRGGPSGAWGYMVQAKAMRVLEEGAHAGNRFSLQGNFFTPLMRKGKLVGGARIDGQARLDASSSGYLGGEGGFTYEASKDFNLSAGAYGYRNFGTPLYVGDHFLTDQGFVVRGDIFGNSTNFSIMFRYDPTQGWFDREYRFSQVVGPIEPVIVYRASPHQYQLGFRFRTQDLARMLERRKLERDKTSKSDQTSGGGSE
ncbi:MAG: hypothetical protein JST12_10115 [Armatimonadetes bacterium]|nr:hypothetical protein [Armatimonadota bacterium]MBS1728155.1 hypothetical protein [Armatimonadota bacterium]